MKKYIYPSTATAGSYHPFGQYVQLEMPAADYQEFKGDLMSVKYKEEVGLTIHELRHWLDQVSTLRGQVELIHVYSAFNARINNDYKQFWHIRKLLAGFDRQNPSEYFETVNTSRVDGKWTFSLTCGQRPDSNGFFQETDPIPFVSFADDKGQRIARVPIALPSLLETAAMSQEYLHELKVIESIEDVEEQKIERQKTLEKTIGWVYEPSFALYSAIAHVTSNAINTTDIYETLSISGSLANICLNIPESLYGQVKIPEYCRPWNKINKYLQEAHDIGHLYLCLLFNFVENGGTHANFDLSKILSDSGLPDESLIIKECRQALDLARKNHFEGLLTPMLEKYIARGTELFETRGLMGDKMDLYSIISKNSGPLIIFQDTKIPFLDSKKAIEDCFKTGSLAPIEDNKWIPVMEELTTQCEEFNEVCGL